MIFQQDPSDGQMIALLQYAKSSKMFCLNFFSQIFPSEYLSLDETLYPMRNQIEFRQFNPNKPAKYEMLFKSVNAVNYSYTLLHCTAEDLPEIH